MAISPGPSPSLPKGQSRFGSFLSTLFRRHDLGDRLFRGVCQLAAWTVTFRTPVRSNRSSPPLVPASIPLAVKFMR